ncbi:putative dehydrogenase [Salirhabdus euzebyi]|uniref:Putative dehydrogenase n=1 Tax=Salirhabdus euzebyi TaxID=394506 RepID=A0A841Q9N7_9BACI|nr:Gfo/Idh/MocA family oxidoreductase [Salirhabdus euzebyi]MBB6454952.1 putative dehydrogenase [Salirhabdus euzebyi]
MIRFGVIGTNWITTRFLDAASNIEDFSLVAVYSRTEQKAEEFAEKHGATLTFTSIEKFAASKEIDAVYIASPNSFHAEQAIICMNAGKHVMCEKPLASNVKEVVKMVEAAKKNGVLLMEALKTSFLPNFISIQDNLHKIGKVRRFFASYCQYSSRYDAYKQGTVLNAFNPKFSNGALMDIGVYCIYPLVVLFGEPKSIKANGIMLSSGVDGEGSVLLQYEEMDAIIMYSKIADSYVSSEIQGEDGNIIIDQINNLGKVEIKYRDGRVEDITQTQHDNTMFYEAKEFIDLIKHHKTESTRNSFNHSLLTAKISEQVRKQNGIVYPADLD